jgi:hypothetical protein
MLCIETTDTWAGATIVVEMESNANNTAYTVTTETTVRAVMDALVAVLIADLGGPWSWSYDRDAATGGWLVTLRYADAGDAFVIYGTNADWNGLTGLQDSAPGDFDNLATGTTPAAGTWYPAGGLAVSGHARLLDSGECGSDCVVRPGVPGLAGIQPRVEALGTVLDAARLTGILSRASHPRRVQVYQQHKAVWREYALGAVARSSEGALAYRFTFEVAGEAL